MLGFITVVFLPFLLTFASIVNYIFFQDYSFNFLNPIFFIICIIITSIIFDSQDVKARFWLSPFGIVTLLYIFYFPTNYFFIPKTIYSEHALSISYIAISIYLLFGSIWGTRKSIDIIKNHSEYDNYSIVKVLYIIGLIGTILSIITGNFFGQYEVSNKFLSPLLGVLINIRFVAFSALVAISVVLNKRKSLIVLLLIIELSLAFLTTSKQLIIYPILIILLSKEYFGVKVKTISIIGVAIVIMFLFSITYAVRGIWYTYLGGSNISIYDIFELALATPVAISSLSYSDYYELMEKVITRFHGLLSLNLILEKGAPAGYSAYSGLTYGMSLLVPRVLWPDKPDTDYQIMFGHQFYGIDDSMRVLIPPMQIGVGYLDYGIFGVMLISAFMGMVAGQLNFEFSKLKYNFSPMRLFFSFYIFIQFTKIEAHLFEILSATLKNSVIIYIIVYIFSKKFRVYK